MKTTFKQYLKEATMPSAESEEDLLASIRDGKFTKDGSHLKIVGSFDCAGRALTSLVGSPTAILGSFDCGSNNLTTLIGAPKTVGGSFSCNSNSLVSLEGAPMEVGASMYCFRNNLVSLENIHKHIAAIRGALDITFNPIESHILGLLKINDLRKIHLDDNKRVSAIINKYLPEGDIFACQQELIDAGFEAFAKL